MGRQISHILNFEPYPVLSKLQITNWRAEEDNACLLNSWDTPLQGILTALGSFEGDTVLAVERKIPLGVPSLVMM